MAGGGTAPATSSKAWRACVSIASGAGIPQPAPSWQAVRQLIYGTASGQASEVQPPESSSRTFRVAAVSASASETGYEAPERVASAFGKPAPKYCESP